MASSGIRTTRIEIRAARARAERIRYAAKLRRQSVSAFMLDAAGERAEEVISAATVTVLPGKFFDDLWAALEHPPRPASVNPALARRASMKRRVEQK